jgi:hypothetical protein
MHWKMISAARHGVCSQMSLYAVKPASQIPGPLRPKPSQRVGALLPVFDFSASRLAT